MGQQPLSVVMPLTEQKKVEFDDCSDSSDDIIGKDYDCQVPIRMSSNPNVCYMGIADLQKNDFTLVPHPLIDDDEESNQPPDVA